MDGGDGERRALVAELRARGIADERVLAAIGRVPREAFVPPDLADRAYENNALPIAHRQTISQPYVVALMTEALALGGGERILEIGTGSGYQAAILAELGARVVSVERIAPLLADAHAALERLGYRNVELHVGDGSRGWPPAAPYDRIIVTAAGPSVPSELLEQLGVGGRLIMPIGERGEQTLVMVTRHADGYRDVTLGPVRFVPLIGAGGWPGPYPDDPEPAPDDPR